MWDQKKRTRKEAGSGRRRSDKEEQLEDVLVRVAMATYQRS